MPLSGRQLRVCSTACRREKARRDEVARYFREKTLKRPWVELICHHCGKPYRTNVWVGRRKYCCLACSNQAYARTEQAQEVRREAMQRRRARMRGAFVQRVRRLTIYERDGWYCQICGKSVDRTKQVPHPLAPTIDHILPLAQGGTHEPRNVQCAHFLCNSRKSDRGTVQSRLLA